MVRERLEAIGTAVEIVGITTRGDRDQDRSLAAIGGDGVFIKELEQAVLDRRADAAVHSAKDLPTKLTPDLTIAAVLERGDPRDALISRGNAYQELAALPSGAVVGTSSLRRRALVALARPDVTIRDLRGNVDTRVRKVLDGEYDAAVLAAAGLARLDLLAAVGGGTMLDAESFVPATGQGAICVQCRTGDAEIESLCAMMNHGPSALAVAMERALLERLGGGCLVPIGVHAEIDGTRYRVNAIIASVNGSSYLHKSASGTFADEAGAISRARELAGTMLDEGGRSLVEAFAATAVRG